MRRLLLLLALFGLFALVPIARSPAAEPFTVAFAGDIVCAPHQSNYNGSNPLYCQHRLTDDLLAGVDYVMPLGDLQYCCGTLKAFNNAYNPSWGQYAGKTYPTPGNHEYKTGGAQGYISYWNSKNRPHGEAAELYYSFDIGNWHFASINTGSVQAGCGPPSCAEGSFQNNWLESDLASVPASKGIVMFAHGPWFNSGTGHGSESLANLAPMIEDAEGAGFDLFMSGHEHNYQRYRKQTMSGVASDSGFRQFIVGTGGKGLGKLASSKDVGYETGNATDFGVLKVTFTDIDYSWEFVNTAGVVRDSGGPVAING